MEESGALKAYRRAARLVASSLKETLGENLVSVIVFGSAARGDLREDSDIDLLVIARNLPPSRFERLEIFERAERLVEEELKKIKEEAGLRLELSPILKTLEEASKPTPLYLDLVEDALILYDEEGFMEKVLERVRRRLKELGARRIWRGRRWYWVLKPEVRPGEVIEIE